VRIIKPKNILNFHVISDVHLSDPHDKLTRLFIDTLYSLENEETLFLLGDIFDFIAVKSNYFFELWENVFLAFKHLKKNGVRIFFVEGNHDFGFEHFKSPFLQDCFENYGDFVIEMEHEKLGPVQLRHGDDIVCKPHYLKFRKFVKNKNFQKIASKAVPGQMMQFLFSRYAKISRKQDKYRVLSDNFLNSCLNETLKIYPYLNILIIGHIHVLKDMLIHHKTHFLVGPDWLSRPNYLSYNSQSGFERKFLT
jgi:UDP-2,3-diacylglucosamine pyrophosphatase LpxH